MDTEDWPRQPCPGSTRARLSCEVANLGDLRILRRRLRDWISGAVAVAGPDSAVADSLVLIVDELMSNGLRHGRAPVRLHAVRTGEGLLVQVSDGNVMDAPTPAIGRDPALGGMGLRIVANLTTTRGWDVTDGRKHVWAHLRTG